MFEFIQIPLIMFLAVIMFALLAVAWSFRLAFKLDKMQEMEEYAEDIDEQAYAQGRHSSKDENEYWKGVRDIELGCKTCFSIYESAIPGADVVPCPECKRLPSLDAL